MFILNLVNSFIGKTGNIGMRTSHLITHLNHQKIANFSYSRGVVQSFSAGNKNMGIFGHIPRLLNAYRIYVNLNFIIFSVYLDDLLGQVFSIFILTVAAAESAIGLSILVIYSRIKGSLAIDFINLMKG